MPKRPQAFSNIYRDRPSSSTKGMGLKLFRKEKMNGSATMVTSASNGDLSLPALITTSSTVLLKELVERLEQGERIVLQVGREAILWTAAAKDTFVAQDALVQSWIRVYQLDNPKLSNRRLPAFRAVIEHAIVDAWVKLVRRQKKL